MTGSASGEAASAALHRALSTAVDFASQAARNGEGLGEAVGRVIQEENFPNRDLSLAAACWRNGIPLTCPVTIGADILHAHPNCDGAALGQPSSTDFLLFARSIYPRFLSPEASSVILNKQSRLSADEGPHSLT